jgi:hypothetical protein
MEVNNKVPIETSPSRFLEWNERQGSSSPSQAKMFSSFVRQDVTGKIG